MPKGEFQNRDRDESSDLAGIPLVGGLGELPEDLSNERGDLATYALKAAENMSPDMASAQRGRMDARDTGVGSPKIDYNVRSVYDSRPINHREFNLWFQGEITSEPPAVMTMPIFRSCFFVPSGYVMVLREVTFLVQPFSSLLNYDLSFSIIVNGGIVDPMQVETGPEIGDALPVQLAILARDGEATKTFVFGDEGDSVGVDVQIAGLPDFETTDATFIQVGYYGQFLLKTGVPAQFQAANEAGRARSAVTSSAADFRNIGSSEGVTAKRTRKVPFPNVPILRGGK